MDMQTVQKNFEAKGFAFHYCETAAQATTYLLAQLTGKTVGIGGSMTVKELDIFHKLPADKVFWHWEQGPTALAAATTAQAYLASANGLAETGAVVNIDGTGNRLASTIYGHEAVYLVCGINKLCPDEAAALQRARNVAAPCNAKRLGLDTPCAKTAPGEERCFNCAHPQRICHAMATLWQPPGAIAHFEIVLVGEPMGY